MSQRVDAVRRSFVQCFDGIDAMLEARLIQPCLVLLYSTIDAAAALERDDPNSDVTRGDFTMWADRYIRPFGLGNCTSLDLYAARCGILHTFSAASRLSRAGKANRIGYAFGHATVGDLAIVRLLQGLEDIRCVQIETLNEALQMGFLAFLEDVRVDEVRLARVLRNSEGLFGLYPMVGGASSPADA
jgi:hypothetical protein